MPIDINDRSGRLLLAAPTETLEGVDLRNARLAGADLSMVTRRSGSETWTGPANLDGAMLDNADLTGADLSRASFQGASLKGVKLGGAKLNYNDRDLIAEILRQAAGDDARRLELAELLVSRRDWDWSQFRLMNHAETEWAIAAVRATRRDGEWIDNASLRSACNESANGPRASLPGRF
jgi:uncharacterized protein YjbI with pentapeptide repeats